MCLGNEKSRVASVERARGETRQWRRSVSWGTVGHGGQGLGFHSGWDGSHGGGGSRRLIRSDLCLT